MPEEALSEKAYALYAETFGPASANRNKARIATLAEIMRSHGAENIVRLSELHTDLQSVREIVRNPKPGTVVLGSTSHSTRRATVALAHFKGESPPSGPDTY